MKIIIQKMIISKITIGGSHRNVLNIGVKHMRLKQNED